jgi:hypothetical protein
MASTVRFDTRDRFIWLYGSGWIAQVQWTGHHWVAVELDDFGGFRRRLYDGRS